MKKFYLLMMFALLGMVANAQTFQKVTDVAQLVDGDKVVFVNEEAQKIMAEQKTNNRGAVDVQISGEQIVEIPEGATVFTVGKGVTNVDCFTFFDSVKNGYLYAASSSSNYLKTQSNLDENGEWKIEISTETTVKAQGKNSRNSMRYNPNSGSPLFACYSSGQEAITIYKEAGEVDPNQVVAPTFSLTSGTYFKTQELNLSCATEDAKIFYTIDNGEGVSEDREYLEPIQLTDGIYEINAWATKEGFETSSTVSAIYEIKVIPFEEINVENVKEGKYVIAYNDLESGKSYIMKNEVVSNYYVGAMEFDLTTDTPAETELFVVKQTEGGYIIQNSENTYVALQVSGSHINLKPQEADPFVWNFAKSENGNIVATGQEIDSYMSFKMYNNRIPEFLAEKNGNYPMFYFVSGTSSVNDAVVNEFKAVAVANGIEVNVAEAGLVSVYNAAGQLVANVNVAEGATTINVAGGFYIVKAGNNVAKVLVK